ncbi:MAG: hypothetical protein GY855_09155 [candidate division Zixibacteria bacterium]|nr:hypothetical protein [candidate division Zixibacteria bacterium]
MAPDFSLKRKTRLKAGLRFYFKNEKSDLDPSGNTMTLAVPNEFIAVPGRLF